MPVEIFLKLAGIDGESSDAKHKGEIDVLAWSWGLSQDAGSLAGGGAARVKIENISIQKLVDLASPLLLLFGAEGKHISDGTLTTRRAGKSDGEFLLFKMTDVIVTSVHVAASKDTDNPSESVTLNFGKVEFDYRPTNPDGSLGPGKSFKWDVTSGKPS